jgi:hypothetical protein
MGDPKPPSKTDADPLERGAFHDDLRTYRVRASSVDAPDSFQVLTGPRQDIVLIVSGLNSGDLKATWGPFWRTSKPQWKVWVEESAFRVFYCGRQTVDSAPTSVRFCDG